MIESAEKSRTHKLMSHKESFKSQKLTIQKVDVVCLVVGNDERKIVTNKERIFHSSKKFVNAQFKE